MERLGKVETFVHSVTLPVIICTVTGVAAALSYIRYSLGPVDT